jgi:hypothetical protein
MHICRNSPDTSVIFADFTVCDIAACSTTTRFTLFATVTLTTGLVDVAYIAISSIVTALVSPDVIAFAITAGLIRVTAAYYAIAVAVAFLTIFRLTLAFAGAGNGITILTVVLITAGTVAADLIRVVTTYWAAAVAVTFFTIVGVAI